MSELLSGQTDMDMEIHSELNRSYDYINRDTFPTHVLRKKLNHWQNQLEHPARSERSRQEVKMVIDRINLELSCREREGND